MATTISPDIAARDEYTASASQTIFPYTFWVKEEDYIDVYVNGTLKTLTTDYTVSAVQQDGGANIVFNSGLDLDDVVIIVLNPDIERTADYQTSGNFKATTVNTELAGIISVLQSFSTKLSRKFGLADNVASGASLDLPTTVGQAGKVLSVDGGETALQWIDQSDGTVLNLADASVSTAKIVDGAVTADKFADGSVSAAKIADGAISTAKIADGDTVTKDKIDDDLITNYTDTDIASSDEVLFSDATDNNNMKKDTVQGILNLVPADLAGKADTVITAADKISFFDVGDTDNPKTDTVQGIIDLVDLPVGDLTASNSTELEFVDVFRLGYFYVIDFIDILPAVDGDNFQMQFSNNSGSAYSAGVTNEYAIWGYTEAGAENRTANGGTSTMVIANALGNDATHGLNGRMIIHNPTDSARIVKANWQATFPNSTTSTLVALSGGGGLTVVYAADTIRFYMASGNIASGTIQIREYAI